MSRVCLALISGFESCCEKSWWRKNRVSIYFIFLPLIHVVLCSFLRHVKFRPNVNETNQHNKNLNFLLLHVPYLYYQFKWNQQNSQQHFRSRKFTLQEFAWWQSRNFRSRTFTLLLPVVGLCSVEIACCNLLSIFYFEKKNRFKPFRRRRLGAGRCRSSGRPAVTTTYCFEFFLI